MNPVPIEANEATIAELRMIVDNAKKRGWIRLGEPDKGGVELSPAATKNAPHALRRVAKGRLV